MFQVVIVDDEPIIVEGLAKTVFWEKFGCQVAGTAFSGEEGLILIRKKKPDIIFTDIKMPGIDGLSMIAAIKSEFPAAQIVILTGYRDFDYAQRAIRLGVSRFLLKPSKMDEIREALEATTATLTAMPEEQRCRQLRKEMPDTLSAENRTGQEAAVRADDGKGQKPGVVCEEELDSAASSFIVKQAVAYIKAHYKEKLMLSDVADQVYVSQWHLSKLLNRYQGQSFCEILNGVRISRAKELLKNPSMRIGDIADEVGFLDVAHFSRVFKKMVGVSANEYRNRL